MGPCYKIGTWKVFLIRKERVTMLIRMTQEPIRMTPGQVLRLSLCKKKKKKKKSVQDTWAPSLYLLINKMKRKFLLWGLLDTTKQNLFYIVTVISRNRGSIVFFFLTTGNSIKQQKYQNAILFIKHSLRT